MKKVIEKSANYESEQVLNKLTGQVGVDKELLINSIHSFRAKNIDTSQVEILGKKLYGILLENGLNESDVINPERLVSKIDGFVYDGKFEKALEILEVLDAVEPYNEFLKENMQIFYVDSQFEAELIFKLYPNKKYTQKSINTRRGVYLNLKTQILIQMGKIREAEKVIAEILHFNPVNFDALMFRAELLKTKNLEKYKVALYDCYKVAYTKHHLIAFYKALSKYYEKKSQYLNAYMTLKAINLFEDESFIKYDLDRLEIEMNKTALSHFAIPTKDELNRFYTAEHINLSIPVENLTILVLLYQKYYLTQEDEFEENYLRKILLELNNNKVSVITEIEKLAKANKAELIPNSNT